MDIKIRCPQCETKLVVDDDLIGQAVLCEECDTQFTVEQPIDPVGKSRSGEKPRPREREEPAVERPRSRRRGGDDGDAPRLTVDDFEDDDRPRRRKPKRSSSNLAPMIFGSLLVVMTLGVGVGLFFAFGIGTTTGDSVPAGGKFRLSNPQPFGGGFMVTVETIDNRPAVGRYTVVWRTVDGRGNGRATLQIAGTTRTQFTSMFGRENLQPLDIWVDTEPVSSQILSNVVRLN